MKSLVKVLLIGALLGPVVLYFTPDEYISDMETINDTEDGTRNERLMSWGYGWDMFLANPILGVGAANYPTTVYLYQENTETFKAGGQKHLWGRLAHSMWFTLIPELGLVGIVIYFSIVFTILSMLRRIISGSLVDNSQEASVAKAIIVSMVGFFSCGLFVSILYYPQFWHLVAFSSASFNVFRNDGRGFPRQGNTALPE